MRIIYYYIMKGVVNISIVYVIEEKKKIFDLIKNILKSKNDEKCVFLYDDADCSDDLKQYMINNDILIFKSANSVSLSLNLKNSLFSKIDLAVLGNCKNNFNLHNIHDISKIRTFLLNIDNIENVKNINFANTQIITCGLKEKDTIIFSSIDIYENSVILDLQRSIINIKGESVEPFEEKIIVNEDIINNSTNEDLIFALTTLLFCGRLL